MAPTDRKHVLVPVDDSDRSDDALAYALEMYPEAMITAIHVFDPADLYAPTGLEGGILANDDSTRDHHKTRAETVLEDARKRAADAGVELQTETLVGAVSRSIVRFAEKNGVDRVVIGSHGRTGTSRILLGSVAETVARRSPVPVTIVR